MQRNFVERPEIKLVGIYTRTSYSQETDKMKGQIFPLIQKYFHQALFQKIPNRKKPGTTYCVYTEYDSDYRGAYTYFIGEEVTAYKSPLYEDFERLTVPSQRYAVFTTAPAPMPEVIVNTWQKIWEMPEQELGGARCYHTDFEIYDERAADHQNIVLDVCVGIKGS